MILYKYLPMRFAEAFLNYGEILFRSLSYFRKLEHGDRGDRYEGIHIDAPTTPVRLDNLTTGTSISGAFQFLSSVDQERIFALCCSTELRLDLFKRFDTDACVRILRPAPLFLRCSLAAGWKFPLADPGIIHRHVEYFDPTRASTANIKDPRNLPFFKHMRYADQCEYRAVFARREGFKLLERIVTPDHSLEDEIASARDSEQLLRLGSLKGIAELVLPTDPAVIMTAASRHTAA